MATTFALGAESKRLPACSLLLLVTCASFHDRSKRLTNYNQAYLSSSTDLCCHTSLDPIMASALSLCSTCPNPLFITTLDWFQCFFLSFFLCKPTHSFSHSHISSVCLNLILHFHWPGLTRASLSQSAVVPTSLLSPSPSSLPLSSISLPLPSQFPFPPPLKTS